MIRIGIIGTGGMAKYHAQEFGKTPGVKVVACCNVVEERIKKFAQEWKIPTTYTDYREMLRKEKLDGITNVTPDACHAEISLAAISRGLAVLCEKPLATSLADARKMDRAARKRGVREHGQLFLPQFLRAPGRRQGRRRRGDRTRHARGGQLPAKLADAHGLGRLSHLANLTWRLSTKHGSAGVLGDLGCHIYDLTALLAGDIAQINCTLKTFDKGHPHNRIGPYLLDANDSFVSTVVFKNGALGTIHSSRWASGHHNSLRARVYGDKGAIEVDLDTAYDSYKICKGTKAQETAHWEIVKCKPTPDNVQRFIHAIRTGKKDPCDFANGAKIQAYLHYSMLSDKTGRRPR